MNKPASRAIAYAVSHPATVIRFINRSNIKRFLYMTREDGLRSALSQAANMVSRLSPQEDVPDEPLMSDAYEYVKNSALPPSMPYSPDPMVSIIIPVYNQFEYTRACLRSISENCSEDSIEVIVADDCSTDQTMGLKKHVENLRVIRNEKNLRFILNCNNAARHARGKYLLFLNNDTIVKKNWLSSLVRLMESDPSIGLAGSKFVYPDGSLQEAGGIIWKDGTVWNYGRGRDPSLPEYNYVKDVDYITGASIIVPRELFFSVGGFNKDYAPAYCEDTDLAFTIRKRGYRTVYQPGSEVVHFEGMSNGKTVSSGVRSYQIVNDKKFKEKWKTELERFHAPVGKDVFHARDRSFGKKTILFIDSSIPRFDDNAGNRTVFDYIRTLSAMGYNVKLMPANFYDDREYTRIYEAMGVEVLCGDKYGAEWRSWLKKNADNIDYVMLFRPECAEQMFAPVRNLTNAKIFYNVADLHFVRLRREFEITGDERYRKESESLKKTEIKYLNEADRCITVSSEEAEVMGGLTDQSKVRIYPIFCFDDTAPLARHEPQRPTLLFVGSFNHPPNRDGIKWFLESVMPSVVSKVPDVRLIAVGSKCPEDILKMRSNSLVLPGHVSDDELADLYSECSAVVIPLRYGAGVKGKTVEAMHAGAPIVSTGIGIEGMPGIGEYVTPQDDAESFADETVRMLTDREYAKRTSARYSEYIGKNFSRESMKKLFLKEFGPNEDFYGTEKPTNDPRER